MEWLKNRDEAGLKWGWSETTSLANIGKNIVDYTNEMARLEDGD